MKRLVLLFATVILPLFMLSAQDVSGTSNGHDYVDLGLSVKWATCNVGASSPSDYGDYYAWGETSTKSSYTDKNSQTYGESMGNIGGNSSYDVARANWGGSWRLPTEAEFQELVDKCTWTWTMQGGHKGYKVTSKINGKSIFLPAAGWMIDTILDAAGESGFYWSSTPLPSDDYTEGTYGLSITANSHLIDWSDPYIGCPIRLVIP
ncbi:MAG: hypothetical protein ACI4AK_04455 [Lepagella sp.]